MNTNKKEESDEKELKYIEIPKEKDPSEIIGCGLFLFCIYGPIVIFIIRVIYTVLKEEFYAVRVVFDVLEFLSNLLCPWLVLLPSILG